MGRSSRKRKSSVDLSPSQPARQAPTDAADFHTEPSRRRSSISTGLALERSECAYGPGEEEAATSASLQSAEPYSMEFAIAPPSRMAAGVALRTPLVVTFSIPESKRNVDPEESDIPDLSNVWAYMSLMSADTAESLAPPRVDLLRGRMSDSIHLVQNEPQADAPVFAYAAFADIAITEPGRYWFKVSIIDMNSQVFERGSAEAETMRALQSEAFDVVEEAEGLMEDTDRDDAVGHLRGIGVQV